MSLPVVQLAGEGKHLRVRTMRGGPRVHLHHPATRVAAMRSTDSPEVAAAKRLLDLAKDHGFTFVRIAPGEDGPLLGVRETPVWFDQIFLAGFADSCHATRARKSLLVIPAGPLVAERVSGDALTVLHVVVADWPPI
jgi:hypothetical protein